MFFPLKIQVVSTFSLQLFVNFCKIVEIFDN